jgi:hypothetical protein
MGLATLPQPRNFTTSRGIMPPQSYLLWKLNLKNTEWRICDILWVLITTLQLVVLEGVEVLGCSVKMMWLFHSEILKIPY